MKKILKWFLGLFLETRVCPACSPDPIGAIIEPRKTYSARCPMCGDLWN